MRYHTTGRAHESKTEIVLKLADLLEDSRTYKEAQRLRDALTDDLYASYLLVMRRLAAHEQEAGHGLHPDTAACIKWLEGIKGESNEQ